MATRLRFDCDMSILKSSNLSVFKCSFWTTVHSKCTCGGLQPNFKSFVYSTKIKNSITVCNIYILVVY